MLPFSSARLRKQMVRLGQVDEVEPDRAGSFRMILDGSATMLAAQLRIPPSSWPRWSRRIEVMSPAIDAGYEEFSEADIAFHEAVAGASRNSLIQVCNDVVRGVVLSLISDKVSRARNRRALMTESLGHHAEVP